MTDLACMKRMLAGASIPWMEFPDRADGSTEVHVDSAPDDDEVPFVLYTFGPDGALVSVEVQQ